MQIQATNALVEIKAAKKGDYEQALKIAEMMEKEAQGGLVMVEADEWEMYIVMSAVWDNFQKKEWIELFKKCKEAA